MPRVCWAVAKAAISSGVARKEIDLAAYERKVSERLGPGRDLMSRVVTRARRKPGRILYPEGAHPSSLRAARAVAREKIALPILVGRAAEIRANAAQYNISLDGIEIVDPATDHRLPGLAEELCRIRAHRSQVSVQEASERLQDATWFASMLLRGEHADGMVCGVTKQVRKTIQSVLKVIPLRPGYRLACGLSIIVTNQGVLFLADTAVNIEPSAEDLADIALLAAEGVRRLGIEPVIAMLSFSSFGGSPHPRSDMVRRAVHLARAESPDLLIDGEMRVDAALDPVLQSQYPDCKLDGTAANVLIFPNLEAANISFNLVRKLSDAVTLGPLILGLDRSVAVLQPHSTDVDDIIRMTALTVVEAQKPVLSPA